MTLPSIATLFLRIGNLTFGGGDAITALLQRELVHRRGWLTLDQFGLAQSLARVTPGTGILAFSAATAWMLRRWAGAVSAVLAVSVPSAVLVVLLTWGFTSLSGSARALATLAAILAAAVGMMWAAAWLLVKPQLRSATRLRTAVLVASAFMALSKWSVPPIQVLAAAALIGFFWTTGEDP
ncbi:MAG TPA: chromate transporter [Candidatus Binatia bacterium]|jgi:chromate transporter|nr:chromate transporter [Candidatus Binatia bacterium]